MPSTFAMVPVEVCADDRLSKMQIKVLIALCSFRNAEHNDVWPHRATLKDRCGYSERTISRVTTQLCQLGWLAKAGRGGHGKPCRYRITVPPQATTSAGETVPDSGTVAESETVAEPAPRTVPEPGQERCPNRTRAKNRPRTDHRTDQAARFSKHAQHRKSLQAFADRATDRSWAEPVTLRTKPGA